MFADGSNPGVPDLGGRRSSRRPDQGERPPLPPSARYVIAASMTTPVLGPISWAPFWCGPASSSRRSSRKGGLAKGLKRARSSWSTMNIEESSPRSPGPASASSHHPPPSFAIRPGASPSDGFMGAQPENQIKAFNRQARGVRPAPRRSRSALEEAATRAGKATPRARRELFRRRAPSASPRNMVARSRRHGEAARRHRRPRGRQRMLAMAPAGGRRNDRGASRPARKAIELAEAGGVARRLRGACAARCEQDADDPSGPLRFWRLALNARNERVEAAEHWLKSCGATVVGYDDGARSSSWNSSRAPYVGTQGRSHRGGQSSPALLRSSFR